MHALRLHWFAWASKNTLKKLLAFFVLQLYCVSEDQGWSMSSEQHHRRNPQMHRRAAPDIAMWIPNSITAALMKSNMHSPRAVQGLSSAQDISQHISGPEYLRKCKCILCPLSMPWPVWLWDLMNSAAESIQSFIYRRLGAAAAAAAVRLPVIVSDRQMTSACPPAALGMRHLFLIKQNKGGLWWYHLGVTAPTHTVSVTRQETSISQ